MFCGLLSIRNGVGLENECEEGMITEPQFEDGVEPYPESLEASAGEKAAKAGKFKRIWSIFHPCSLIDLYISFA